MSQTSTQSSTGRNDDPGRRPLLRELINRISRAEIIAGVLIAVVMLALILIEPDILEAPFENALTILFTFGGTAIAAGAFALMLWYRVPVAVRMVVLLVPFVIVNWWLISPYFIDDVVDEGFSTSISEQLEESNDEVVGSSSDDEPTADSTPPTEPADDEPPAAQDDSAVPDDEEPETPPEPSGPVLLGAGQFVGLAGHSGTGDAAIFENPDGSLLLRFENFDIENGPDLEVYLVPGADQTSLPDGSIHLGALKGNIGDQNYDLPAGTQLDPGAYTVLIWCEAFSVEFVGATLDI